MVDVNKKPSNGIGQRSPTFWLCGSAVAVGGGGDGFACVLDTCANGASPPHLLLA